MFEIKNNIQIDNRKWKPLMMKGDPLIPPELGGYTGIEVLSLDDIKESKPKKRKRSVSSKHKKSKKMKIEDDLREDKVKQQVDSQLESEWHAENMSSIEVWRSLGISDLIIRALMDQNFYSPTAIQSLVLPSAILGRRDMMAAAETGSGKTLAFGIPIINGILKLKEQKLSVEKKSIENDSPNKMWNSNTRDNMDATIEESENDWRVDDIKFDDSPSKCLYALILTPTRELANQIKLHLVQALKYTDIKVVAIFGGMAEVKQERLLKKKPEIVVATPGRLWQLIQEGNPHLNQIDSIRYLAIDETDRLMEKGHFQELHKLLKKINADPKKVQKRQTFVFSATLTMVHDLPDYLERKKKYIRSKIYKQTPGLKLQKIIDMFKMKKPKIFDITQESGTVEKVIEYQIQCAHESKDYYMYYILKTYSGRTLVFCNSISCVKRLTTLCNILQCNAVCIHANMQQRQRLKNLDRFQNNENGLLIATDVAARGLDIPNVKHVIHYQVPTTAEGYVHRSGRTARAQKEGITVLIMDPSEDYRYKKILKTLGRTHELPSFPAREDVVDTFVKNTVNVAREVDKLELKFRRDNEEKNWLEEVKKHMDIDEYRPRTLADEENVTIGVQKEATLRRYLKAKKKELNDLLSKSQFLGSLDRKNIFKNDMLKKKKI